MLTCRLTRHAEIRANQRGVTHAMIETLIANADVEEPVGRGCSVLRISRRSLERDGLRKLLGEHCDRLASLALVWSEDTAEIVTVLHVQNGGRGRRYRRGH